MNRPRILLVLLTVIAVTAGIAWALPSLVQHVDAPHTIEWEADGIEDGNDTHNHRRNQDFGGIGSTAEPFSAYSCWDNQQWRLDTAGDFDNGHCYIAEWGANQPTWSFVGNWPAAAMDRVREAAQIYSDIVSDHSALTTGLELVEVAMGTPSDFTIEWVNIPDASNGGRFQFINMALQMDSSFNWFFGANPMEGQPGGIQNGEWHFFSVLLHEMGHALGLAHQTDGADLMSPPVGEPPNVAGHRYFMGPDADTIDGLRDLYSQPWNYWDHVSGNGGSGQIFWWNIASDDSYVSGDFDGDGDDDLLAINPNGWHHTMVWTGSNWQYVEGGSNGQIHWWVIASDDFYVTGDFNGDGRDELLAINPNGWHQTMRFNGSSWQYIEGGSNGQVAWWVIDNDDWFVSGDFEGDGDDDLLAINPNGWHHTMRFNGSSWQYVGGGNNGLIGWWNISSSDRFRTGDFNGDGSDELLAINPSNGWHQTMDFGGSNWSWIEGNGSGQIHWWILASADRYVTGDFDGDGSGELLAINPSNGWSHTIGYTPNSWGFQAGNGGLGSLAFWLFAGNDQHVSGDFDGDGVVELLSVNPNGWWHVSQL